MRRVELADLAAATIFAVFRVAFFPRVTFGALADFGLGATLALLRASLTAPRFRTGAPLAAASREAAERLAGRLLMFPPAAYLVSGAPLRARAAIGGAPLQGIHLLPRAPARRMIGDWHSPSLDSFTPFRVRR